MHRSMPFLTDKVEGLYDYKYNHWENGVSFQLHFIGLDYDQPTCSIHPSKVNLEPLTGNDPIATVEHIQAYGGSIMFEPIHL